MVWQDPTEFLSEMSNQRHAAWLDIAATIAVAVLVLQIAIYVLVTRPLDRLVTAIEKVEQGYPARSPMVWAARELRWLQWRFERMSASLTNSARLLVSAHRRAMQVARSRPKAAADLRLLDPLRLEEGAGAGGRALVRRYFRSRCALLEASNGNPDSVELAREVWTVDAVEAERLGEVDLKARLENAALMVLDRDAFDDLSRRVRQFVADRDLWTAATVDTIRSALVSDNVQVVEIQRRTKHVAGVWRKIREKHLDLREVHDIFAFRIIVDNHDDCYLALDTIHRLYEPEPFRFKDYIASPKANGYRSLHTSVRDRDGLVFEVQIRSVDMHLDAEGGDAAHWRYHAARSLRSAPRRMRTLLRLGR